MKRLFPTKMLALLACLMCTMSALAQEAYAVFTPDNTTLTFYYDNQRSARPGTSYDLNEGNNVPGWIDEIYGDGLTTQVVFNPSFASARPTTTYSWFKWMYNLQNITGIEYLNTSQVTSMASMFSGCEVLSSLDVSGFNTSHVTDMSWMFNLCSSLTRLDLGSFNTSHVTDMTMMFNSCYNLIAIYVGSGWSTASVTASDDMFFDCQSLLGGNGTRFDNEHFNASYAHIDGGPSNPGYLRDTNVIEPTEAYVEYDDLEMSLTFYYDNQRSMRLGLTFGMNTGNTIPEWCNNSNSSPVYYVVFDPSFAEARPTTTCSWFSNMYYLRDISGMEYLNTSQVTSMASMFNYCYGLRNIDVSGFNTVNVTDMSSMFESCFFTSIDLSSFNTGNVTDMSMMFRGCYDLTSLDLTNFNTRKVENMNSMFEACSNLITIYVGSGWSTESVSSSDYMFSDCQNLLGGRGTGYDERHVDATYAHIDGGHSNPGYFRDPNVVYQTGPYAVYDDFEMCLTFYNDDQRGMRRGMIFDLNTGNTIPEWCTDSTSSQAYSVVFDPSFANARPITTYAWFYHMNNLDTFTGMEYLNTSQVTSMANMFNGCTYLMTIDLTHFNTSNVTDMSGMFANCRWLTDPDFSYFDTSNVTDMSEMFSSCDQTRDLDVSSFNTANVTDMNNMFNDCVMLTDLELSHFNTAKVTNMCNMFSHCESLTSLDLSSFNTEKVTDMSGMFNVCWNLTSLDVRSFNTSKVTDMKEMFYYCDHLTSLDLSNFYTEQVTDMTNMFYGCHFVESLDLSGFYTPNVTSMAGMFGYCNKLTSIDLSSFNTAKVTNMNSMFEAYNGKILDVSNFNTANVTEMSRMFLGCFNVRNLDLSNFNTEKVTDMSYMFAICDSLEILDLRNFNTAMVNDMDSMFYACHNLTTIIASRDWDISSATTNNMFIHSSRLVGSMGTRYNINHVDGEYAHIDGGPSNPGYFSSIQKPGDADGDGVAGVSDVTVVLDAILTGDMSGIDFEAADVDGNGVIDISDITALIDFILTGEWP